MKVLKITQKEAAHVSGLTAALRQVAAEEKLQAVQMKLFETLKTEDVKKVQ